MAIEIKANINKWDLIKLISSCTANYKQNKTNYKMGEDYLKMMQ